jgi:hypothetical protein
MSGWRPQVERRTDIALRDAKLQKLSQELAAAVHARDEARVKRLSRAIKIHHSLLWAAFTHREPWLFVLLRRAFAMLPDVLSPLR